MVSGVSGSNLATSLRELDQLTPLTQHETLSQTQQKAIQKILQAKTDTVNISDAALAMSRSAERADPKGGKPEEQTAERTPTRG